jgi:microcystin-dependent protein
MSVTQASLLGDTFGSSASGTVPVGGIIMWSGSVASIPTGWSLCNGANGTPNLQDKFIVGAGSGYGVGATGGDATVELQITQIPSHNHGGLTGLEGGHSHGFDSSDVSGGTWYGQFGLRTNRGLDSAYGGDGIGQGTITLTGAPNHAHDIPAQGGGEAHENRPPYYALAFIMRVS